MAKARITEARLQCNETQRSVFDMEHKKDTCIEGSYEFDKEKTLGVGLQIICNSVSVMFVYMNSKPTMIWCFNGTQKKCTVDPYAYGNLLLYCMKHINFFEIYFNFNFNFNFKIVYLT